MRYYDIIVSNADGTEFARYTSRLNNKPIPNALQVEFDIPVTVMAAPIGAASIKIWGVSLQTIGQSSDFNGKLIKVFAGMQAGLPLANPAQSGLVLQGVIWQAFGNWIDTNQWLEFEVVTAGGDLDEQLNITLNWEAGTSLGTAATQTLNTALPKYKVIDKTSGNLVLPAPEPGMYTSLLQFAQYLKTATQPIIGGNYPGVDLLATTDTITLYDGTAPEDPVIIDFRDLIGQPVWIDPGTVQLALVMRADLFPSKYIKLPTTQVTTTAGSYSQYRDKSVFQGNFLVTEARHIGNFRQTSAASWVTTINCSPTTPAGLN